jgi:hypothetical protein
MAQTKIEPEHEAVVMSLLDLQARLRGDGSQASGDTVSVFHDDVRFTARPSTRDLTEERLEGMLARIERVERQLSDVFSRLDHADRDRLATSVGVVEELNDIRDEVQRTIDERFLEMRDLVTDRRLRP